MNAVVWSVGTGLTTVPTANAVAQWCLVSGQGGPIHITEAPVAAPAKVVYIHNANGN
jgi:hypothetical protein